MSLDDRKAAGAGSLTPFDRARMVSEALAQAARRARYSSRSRSLAQGGFGARPGQRLAWWLTVISFWLMVMLPAGVIAAYYAVLASDQYLSTIKFTVSGAETPAGDGLSRLTGMPALSIVQDTQIVANHLGTRAAVEAIDARLGIVAHYGSPDVDWYARFNTEKPIEKFVRYWREMVTVYVQAPSGIVDVEVKAFTPEMARDVSQAIIEISETLINEMNDRMNRDALAAATADLQRASARLSLARIELQKARNEAGLIDVARATEGLTKLITEQKSIVLQLQQEFQSQLRFVNANAPQMQALRARIGAAQKQVADLEAQLTTRDGPANTAALSQQALRFSELELERQIAERLYAGSIAALEAARINAERKKMYLNTFVTPTLPQEARYPRRVLWSALLIAGLVAIWGALVGTVAVLRNYMA